MVEGGRVSVVVELLVVAPAEDVGVVVAVVLVVVVLLEDWRLGSGGWDLGIEGCPVGGVDG
jgi:hypothetical protein